jgi:hypothetical protein
MDAESARPGLQPSGIVFASCAQADGLGWYGGAPSVLGFAAARTSDLQAQGLPSPDPIRTLHFIDGSWPVPPVQAVLGIRFSTGGNGGNGTCGSVWYQ